MSDIKKFTSPKLEFSSESLSDLEDIWLHFSIDGEEKADKVLKQITDKFSKLLVLPKIGKERNDLFIGLRSFLTGKYIIFYQEIEKGIEIVRGLHTSRNIEQIFDEMIPLEP